MVQVPAQVGTQPQLMGAEPQVLETHWRRTGTPSCWTQICPSWQGAPVEHENVEHAPCATFQAPCSQSAATRPKLPQSW
jgi:hypothetical protein